MGPLGASFGRRPGPAPRSAPFVSAPRRLRGDAAGRPPPLLLHRHSARGAGGREQPARGGAFKREPLCSDGWDLKFSLPPWKLSWRRHFSPRFPPPPRGCPGAARSPLSRDGRAGGSGALAGARRRSRAARPGSGPGGAGAAARRPVPARRARQRSPRGIRCRRLRSGRAAARGFCCLSFFGAQALGCLRLRVCVDSTELSC